MAIHEELPVPSFRHLGVYEGQDELLYSEARYTQKGMTLPAGTDVWMLGTVMAENTAAGPLEGRYYPVGTTTYNGNAVTLGPAEGLLRHTVQLYADREQFQNLMISGIAKLGKVRGYDQTALDQLGAVISVRRDTFKF